MPDNVAITSGLGTAVATDEVAVNGGVAGHVQFVKLVDGASNGTVGIPGDAQGLAIINRRDLIRTAANSSGLTIATTAYTAGDQLGALITLNSAARASGGSGTIVGVTVTDAADIIGSIDVVFFRSAVTLAADNAPFAISDTDALTIVGIAQLAGAYDLGNNRFCQATNIAIPYTLASGTDLYAALITRMDHTFFTAATNLQLQVFIERN